MAFSVCLFFRLLQAVSGLMLCVAHVSPEFFSLSCGSPRETSFIEKTTGITYNSDESYIDTGVGRSIKPMLNAPQHTWYLRNFPQGNRNCYTFNLATGDKYLIRTIFLHGGYDNNASTVFELHIGPNMWTTVKTRNETNTVTYELIHKLTTDRLQICLVKTEHSTPFISSLELRKLHSDTYRSWTRGSLETLGRKDVGSVSKQIMRNGANDFDRIWSPFNCKDWSKISTTNQNKTFPEQLPEAVMVTASVPSDPDAPMKVPLPELYPDQEFYVVMHFYEIIPNETSIFSLIVHGKVVGKVTSDSLRITSEFITVIVGPDNNGPYSILLQRNQISRFPPLLNAFEIYRVKVFSQNQTDTKEVSNNSSYIHKESPTIISLNLSASGLTGEILNSISNLTNLQFLDLSNNNLTGSIPEFLAKLDSLRLINLSSNRLTGSVPISLLDKEQRGSLTLSIEGNLRLCSSASCASSSTLNHKKERIVISVIVISLIIAAATIYLITRKRRVKLCRHPSIDDDNSNLHQRNQCSFQDTGNNLFTYEELAQATGNFSVNNLIGQGGFGYVHKGILPNGTEVAIKQLKAESGQGECEFQAEIQTISRVHHRHLVSLLGYCIKGSQRLLVYEFVANSTLESHLHDRGRQLMEWTKRFKIALGSAKGLSYLHDDCYPKIIHRDIKAANILIEDSYEAKILSGCSYLAPEYASTGRLTEKSDVFSFGVVLLELISGRRPIEISQCAADYDGIVDWATPLMIQALNDGNFDGLVDPRLEHDFNVSEMRRVITCAAASLNRSAKSRPTMSEIVRILEGNISPGDLHCTHSSFDGLSEFRSTKELQNFKKIALESHTFSSSKCSGLTSRSGQNPSSSSSTTQGLRTAHEIELEIQETETEDSW